MAEARRDNGRGLEGRVSSLEAGLESLTQSVQSLAQTVEKTAAQSRADNQRVMETMEARAKTSDDRLVALGEKLATSQRPQYSVWVGVAGVALAILATFGNQWLEPQQVVTGMHSALLEQIVDRGLEHLSSVGHRGTLERLDHLKESCERTRQDIRQEIDALDAKVQREMTSAIRGLGTLRAAEHRDLRRRLDRLEEHRAP